MSRKTHCIVVLYLSLLVASPAALHMPLAERRALASLRFSNTILSRRHSFAVFCQSKPPCRLLCTFRIAAGLFFPYWHVLPFSITPRTKRLCLYQNHMHAPYYQLVGCLSIAKSEHNVLDKRSRRFADSFFLLRNFLRTLSDGTTLNLPSRKKGVWLIRWKMYQCFNNAKVCVEVALIWWKFDVYFMLLLCVFAGSFGHCFLTFYLYSRATQALLSSHHCLSSPSLALSPLLPLATRTW